MKFSTKFEYANLISKFISNFIKKKNNVVLLYHSIKKIDSIKNHNNLDIVDVESFLNQIKILSYDKKFKDRVTPLISNLNKVGSISITFDDGYIDNITNVYPIIRKFNIPITIFICTELIGKDGYLNKNDIEFLSNQKNIAIGSHSSNHIPLSNLEISSIEEKLLISKNYLQDITNKKINLFSYPHGSYNIQIVELIKSLKIYDMACCSSYRSFLPKNVSKFLIPRIPIWYLDNSQSFINKLDSNWDWMSLINK